jgi:sialidase-1
MPSFESMFLRLENFKIGNLQDNRPDRVRVGKRPRCRVFHFLTNVTRMLRIGGVKSLLLFSAIIGCCRLTADDDVFRTVVRKQGDDGVHTYRIPGLATSVKGTVLAVFDIRHKGVGDLPADIDVGLMRSTDDGTTWGAMQRILDFDAAEPKSRGNGVGDPTILVDKKTGTIFVTALHSKGDRAWKKSGPGLSAEETGQFVMTKSTDDGETWSEPWTITPQVKEPAWRLCFNGPGNGIQLRDGTLVFPAQFKGADDVPHSCFISSADGGVTWKISSPAIPGAPPTSEASLAECADGSLLLSMRDESRSGQRAWARWSDGKWSASWAALPDPTCMASLIRHPSGALGSVHEFLAMRKAETRQTAE